MHIPSRRALRDDPDFDKVVTTLYASTPDYDRQENAYSAHVTKASMVAEKQAREQERAAKKIRAEEAAKAAAEMREKYRAEAEVKAKAKAEADAIAKAEQDALMAANAEKAEAAASAAAEAARQRMEEEMRLGEEREKQTLAKEEMDYGRDDDGEDDDEMYDVNGDDPKTPKAGGKRGASTTTTTEKKKAKSGRPKGSKNEKKDDAPKTPYIPVFTSKPVKVGGTVVVEMPDDFSGLYAMRVGDDKVRLNAQTPARGKKAQPIEGTDDQSELISYQVELKRLSTDGGVGLIKNTFVLLPGVASIKTVVKLISQETKIPSDNVRVFSSDGVDGECDEGMSVADAVYGQIRGGVVDVELRYSVV